MRHALLLCVLCSCAARQSAYIVPAARPQPTKPQAEHEGLKLWANTAPFSNAPSDITAWVAVVGVDIANDSDRAVEFLLDDLRLVDDKGRTTKPFFVPIVQFRPQPWGRNNQQFKPINVEALRQGVRDRPAETADITAKLQGNATAVFIAAVSAPPSGADEWFDETGLSTAPPISWKEEVRFVGGPQLLATRALTERFIRPHTRTQGFLYFPRVAEDAHAVVLRWSPQGLEPLRVPFLVVLR